ncbi:MAG: glycosyltransferase family 39 protein [Planctomycetota bacterium]
MTPERDAGDGGDRPRFLERRRGLLLGAILLLAAVLRLIYVLQIEDGPCSEMHRLDQGDMHYFDGWARQIAAGDLLSREIRPPSHPWHRKVAEIYFKENPDQLPPLTSTDPKERASEASDWLWNKWCGGGRFYQDPLYSYFLALVYACGGGPRQVVYLQLLLGVLSVFLIHRITRRHFGEGAGLLAALGAALCGPLLFYDGMLLRGSLITFMGLLLVDATDRAVRVPSGGRWALAGFLGGLSILLRSNFALFVAGQLAAAIFGRRPRHAFALLIGASLALLPLVARNVAVGVPPLGVSSAGGLNIILANSPGFDPELGFNLDEAQVARLMGQSEGRALASVFATIQAHENPLGLLRILGQKLRLTCLWHEKPNNVNYYFVRQYAGVLYFAPLGALLIIPLAALGLALAIRRFRRGWTLYLLVVTSLVPLLLIFVLSRYRAPLLAACLPFAGYAVVRLWDSVRRRRVAQTALMVAFLAAVGAVSASPWTVPLVARISDYLATYVVYYNPRLTALEASGDYAGAAALLADAVRHEPRFVSKVTPENPRPNPGARPLLSHYAGVYARYASALEKSGQPEKARALRERSELFRRLDRGG